MAETLASLFVRIGADITDFEKNMKGMEKNLKNIGGKLQDIGGRMATSFGAAGAAVAAGLGIASKTAMDFEAQMSRVGAISGASSEQLDLMRQSALDLGASTSKSASEVAKGMENLAAMGFEVNEVIGAMPGVISAAEASGEDMAMTAGVIASALNAWGLEASEAGHVADVLAMSANQSAAGINDLGYAFKYAAPVANMLGVSMETLAAATGIMTDAGLAGEQAGTSLRMALLRLAEPTTDGAALLEEFGVQLTDASGNMMPFDQIVGQLKTGLEGMGNAQQAAALSTIFGTEAVSGMLAVIQKGPDELRKLTKGLEESDGASAKTASQMRDNLKGAIEELSGAFETAQITVGNSLTPALTFLADKIKGLVEWFNQLSPRTQEFIAIGAALTAALLLAVGAFGALLAAVGAMITGFSAIMPVITAVGVFIAGLSLPITATIAVISALVIAWVAWGDQISAITMQVVGWITTKFNELMAFFQNFSLVEVGKNLILGLWEGINSLGDWIRSKVLGFVNSIGSTIKDFFGIASPSKLMIYYGQMIDEGLAEGIESSKGKPISAMDNMAQAITGALQRIDNQLSLSAQIAEAKFRLIGLQMEQTGLTSDVLKDKLGLLNEQIQIQNEKITMANQAYEDMKKVKGETAEETQRLLLKLIEEKTSLEELKGKVKDLAEEWSKATAEKKRYADTPSGGGSGGGGGSSSGGGGWSSTIRDSYGGVGTISDKGESWDYRKADYSKATALAEGGIVTRPTFAMIGEGGESEAVIPLSKLNAMMSPTSGATTVIVELDGREIARGTAPHLTDLIRLKTGLRMP